MKARHLRRIAAAVTVVVAGALLSSALSSGATDPPANPYLPNTGQPFAESDIPVVARAAAARHGDPNPTAAQHVSTTRALANQAAGGDVVQGDGPSYLVVIHGHFVVPNILPPMPNVSTQLPATTNYSVITLVIDASTGDITDAGLTNDVPDLARLGNVHTDFSN